MSAALVLSASSTDAIEELAGVRVLLDLRPLQEPERSPITSAYLSRLTRAYAARPVSDERFVLVLRVLRPDPTPGLAASGLPIVGRRRILPTARFLRSVGLALDAVLLRGAARGADRPLGPAMVGPSVYHGAGGALPLAAGIPVVASLLDLAPWELPDRYARTRASRAARDLRARGLRRAARVLVSTPAVADAAVRLLDLDPALMTVLPLAADDAFAPHGPQPDLVGRLRAEYGLPDRYLIVGGRYDARSDLRSVLQALAALRRQDPTLPGGDWPPRLILVGAAVGEGTARDRIGALVVHYGVDDLVAVTPWLADEERAALARSSRGHIQPSLSDATGLAALDALAAGVPVLGTRAGCLPEVVGQAGIIVEPGQPARMASAIRALWEDAPVAQRLWQVALERATGSRRQWADVAADTRDVYREVAHAASRPSAQRDV